MGQHLYSKPGSIGTVFGAGINTGGQLITQNMMNMLNGASFASLPLEQFLTTCVPYVGNHGKVTHLDSILQ